MNEAIRTYFDPRLRHFRCPGMNLVALDRRIEPDGIDELAVAVADFAGDRFNDAIVDGSMWWWYDAGMTDSLLLLLPDDEFGTDVGGSSISDFLKLQEKSTF